MSSTRNTIVPGKLTIARTSNHEIRIYLEDASSGVPIVCVKCTPEDFGNAVTGLGDAPCSVGYRTEAWAVVGKRHEHKEELIEVQGAWGRLSAGECQNILAPYEIDGWIGDPSDLNNHHRLGRSVDGTAIARVGFHRHVDANEVVGS
jgi:hypothetical protein